MLVRLSAALPLLLGQGRELCVSPLLAWAGEGDLVRSRCVSDIRLNLREPLTYSHLRTKGRRAEA